MNFTDSPYEWMMKRKPYTPHRDRHPDAPDDKRRDGERKHSGKQGDSRRRETSGRFGPKLKP